MLYQFQITGLVKNRIRSEALSNHCESTDVLLASLRALVTNNIDLLPTPLAN